MIVYPVLRPQLWGYVTEREVITLQQVYLIWISMMLVSLFAGLFFLPWHSVDESISWTSNSTCDNFITSVRKGNIFKPTQSLKTQLATNLGYLKSPLLIVTVYSFK